MPPTLLLHGSEDRTVLPWKSEQLARRLAAADNRVVYRPLAGIGHIEILLALAEPFQHLAPVIEAVDSFIRDTDRSATRARLQGPVLRQPDLLSLTR